jgi:hypothetical protein
VGTTTIPLDFHRGYIESFNFTVEQEFAGFYATAGYVGSRRGAPAAQLNLNINPALAIPGLPATFGQNGRALNAEFGKTTNNICPPPTNPTAKCKGWPDINQLTPAGSSSYDALQAKLTRQFSGGSQIGFVYTFSKAIDYEDNEEINFMLWPSAGRFPMNKALAGFDRTQNFAAYGVHDYRRECFDTQRSWKHAGSEHRGSHSDFEWATGSLRNELLEPLLLLLKPECVSACHHTECLR